MIVAGRPGVQTRTWSERQRGSRRWDGRSAFLREDGGDKGDARVGPVSRASSFSSGSTWVGEYRESSSLSRIAQSEESQVGRPMQRGVVLG